MVDGPPGNESSPDGPSRFSAMLLPAAIVSIVLMIVAAVLWCVGSGVTGTIAAWTAICIWLTDNEEGGSRDD